MSVKSLPTGVAHTTPKDLKEAILSDSAVSLVWSDITPLARNEWICWVISVKKEETRREHTERLCSQLKAGKRRPCCWPGCPHRKKG